MAHTPRFARIPFLIAWVGAGVFADILVRPVLLFFFTKKKQKKLPLAHLRAQKELEFLYFPITDGAVAKDRYVRDFVGKLLARIHAGELDGKREGGWGKGSRCWPFRRQYNQNEGIQLLSDGLG